MWCFGGMGVHAGTVYDSPLVTFSPDGKAWTMDAGDKASEWYPRGTEVQTGIPSQLRALQPGEHYYQVNRPGTIPVGSWRVVHPAAQCIHNEYPEGDYHGIVYNKAKCLRPYYSGWYAYCADCGEPVAGVLMYASEQAVASIDYLDTGMGLYYYYTCPHCNNLEQGCSVAMHQCKAISYNRYRVEYDANTNGERYAGFMSPSYHTYNDAEIYEGKALAANPFLSTNTYSRTGYVFVGWNTEPDGDGSAYGDGARILNLTTHDYFREYEAGIVTLYAQWEPVESVLQIDSDGGSYGDREGIVTVRGGYGESCYVDAAQLQPPSGHRVSFECNGGTPVEDIVGVCAFTEWQRVQPFAGKLEENHYYFPALDNNVDTVRAIYEYLPISLPSTRKEGSSFGGWYLDEACTEPVGGAGSSLIPREDMVLYAGWVELTLTAEDNYAADGGRGAVDLEWYRPDGANKVYRLYQREAGAAWNTIYTKQEIGGPLQMQETMGYTGREQAYTVPHTGLYELTAYGARGGAYGLYQGGYGGGVKGTFWLEQGDVLRITVGGMGGYPGGGKATSYGNGGGYTKVVSERKGELLYAGGGGGACNRYNGKPGGSMASVTEGHNGEKGGAGGGGGYYGGTAGNYLVHHHEESCYHVQDKSYTLFDRYAGYHSPWMNWFLSQYYANGKDKNWRVNGSLGYAASGDYANVAYHTLTDDEGDEEDDAPSAILFVGADRLGLDGTWEYTRRNKVEGVDTYLPVEGNTTMDVLVSIDGWGESPVEPEEPYSFLVVMNQEGKEIYRSSFVGKLARPAGDGEFLYAFKVPVPKETTQVYLCLATRHSGGGAWVGDNVRKVQFSGGISKELICGYEEGQVIASEPAYGGSNYVAVEAFGYESYEGVRAGDGAWGIRSVDIGYHSVMSLEGVCAPDREPPDRIAPESIRQLPGESLTGFPSVRVSWSEPEDAGTTYFHKVQAYLPGAKEMLQESNITFNTLISGLKGYRYRLNQAEDTRLTQEDAFLVTNSLQVPLTEEAHYLHLAPEDVAGNLGETIHIPITGEGVAWALKTKPLSITDGKAVYYDAQADRYYVKADGFTPFQLYYRAYIEGVASKNYQPTDLILESSWGDKSARNLTIAATQETDAESVFQNADALQHRTEGESLLNWYADVQVVRSGHCREIAAEQMYVLSEAASGQIVEVIPVVGADYADGKIYSAHAEDAANGLTLVGDGQPPVISGLEILEELPVIDKDNMDITLQITAQDALSGLDDFYVKISNSDNFTEKIYRPEAQGRITLCLTDKDPVFNGDFTVSVYASDRVGNEATVSYGTTEFALQTRVERMIAPHEPVFQRGESGVLHISCTGYADRIEVEFPEMLLGEENAAPVYQYEAPQYLQEEAFEFMIPLYAAENDEYVIKVRAYKGDRMLEQFPRLTIIGVEGSILDDIRTRLR